MKKPSADAVRRRADLVYVLTVNIILLSPKLLWKAPLLYMCCRFS